MDTIYSLLKRAKELKEKSQVDSITPEEVGKLHEDTLAYIASLEQSTDGLGIKKVYQSKSAMEADTDPVGTNGKALRYGQLVSIYDDAHTDSSENGNIYAYQKPGWLLMGRTNNEVTIVQEPGDSATKVMSQAAVSSLLPTYDASKDGQRYSSIEECLTHLDNVLSVERKKNTKLILFANKTNEIEIFNRVSSQWSTNQEDWKSIGNISDIQGIYEAIDDIKSKIEGRGVWFGNKIDSSNEAVENLGYKVEKSGIITFIELKTVKADKDFPIYLNNTQVSTVKVESGVNKINVNIPVNTGDVLSAKKLCYKNWTNGNELKSYNSQGTQVNYSVYLRIYVETVKSQFVDINKKISEQGEFLNEMSALIDSLKGVSQDFGKTVDSTTKASLILGYKSELSGRLTDLDFFNCEETSDKILYINSTEYNIGRCEVGLIHKDVDIPISEGDIVALQNLAYINTTGAYNTAGALQPYSVHLRFTVFSKLGRIKGNEINSEHNYRSIRDIEYRLSDLRTKNLNSCRNLKVSLIGDSISTYKDYTDGYPTAYPQQDVNEVYKTYWNLIISKIGAHLDINAAYSGSSITTNHDRYFGVGQSFINRADKLGNPHIILVHGGTNDKESSQGDYDYTDSDSESDTFRPAFARLLNKIIKTYPLAYVVVIISSNLGADFAESERMICKHYNIDYVDMSISSRSETVIDHPNAKDMEDIASAVLSKIDFTRVSSECKSISFSKTNRPHSKNRPIGDMIFDTDLCKPLWYAGNKLWVDSDGNTVENPEKYK